MEEWTFVKLDNREVWSVEYRCVTSMSALHLEKPSMLVEGTDRTGPKGVSALGHIWRPHPKVL